MVLVEGSCPISTPGNKVEPFSEAVSGSNIGKLVIMNRSRPYTASEAPLNTLFCKRLAGTLYSKRTSRSFR